MEASSQEDTDAASGGNAPASAPFGDRIAREVPRLRHYARKLVRDITAADDLVQDTVARALAKRHLWQEGTDLRAWLFTILHNQHVNRIRRTVVREGYAVEIASPDLDPHPALRIDPSQENGLKIRDLRRALKRLPREQRDAILMVGLEEMKYEAVAERLGAPVGTIRSRLSRGREALRALMAGERRQAEQAMARGALDERVVAAHTRAEELAASGDAAARLCACGCGRRLYRHRGEPPSRFAARETYDRGCASRLGRARLAAEHRRLLPAPVVMRRALALGDDELRLLGALR